jgi:hypothetical protein
LILTRGCGEQQSGFVCYDVFCGADVEELPVYLVEDRGLVNGHRAGLSAVGCLGL